MRQARMTRGATCDPRVQNLFSIALAWLNHPALQRNSRTEPWRKKSRRFGQVVVSASMAEDVHMYIHASDPTQPTCIMQWQHAMGIATLRCTHLTNDFLGGVTVSVVLELPCPCRFALGLGYLCFSLSPYSAALRGRGPRRARASVYS